MKKFVLSLILAILCGISAFAYDFYATCESGQRLYYNIRSSTSPYTVQVTYQREGTSNNNYTYYSTNPTGNLTIPSSVAYNGRTYSVTHIGQHAFRNCSGLTSVTIPNSVTSIGQKAFAGCNGLVDMTIPFVGGSATATEASASTLFGYIFEHSTYSSSSSSTQPTGSIRQLYQSGGVAYGIYAYIPSSLRSVTVTGGNLLHGAFANCSMLTSVTIPDSITSIGQAAFAGCSGLTSFSIPNSVTSIDERVFSGCSGLTEVTIPPAVTSIGFRAFDNCTGLTEVTIPPTVTSIEGAAFIDCSGLTTVNFNATNCTTMGEASSYVFPGCSSFTTLNIGENVTLIPQYAFLGCTNLTTLIIPNSVTSIGNSAFYNCNGLTELSIGESVASIGNSAFYNCSGLTTVTIPNSVTSIGVSAFKNCSGLVDMTIPFVGRSATATEASASTLFGYIFGYITNLQTSTTGTTLQYYSPRSSIYAYIPSSLRSVTVTGGNLLYGAFYNCSMLTSVTIPNSVTSIGNGAFWNCSGLTDIYANPTIPPSANSSSFYNVSVSATVWVPCGAATAYREADFWSNFSDIREMLPYTLNVTSADLTMGTASVTQQPNCNDGIAIITATPLRGYAFSQWNDGNTDNPRTVTVTADVEYTASFVALPAYTITAVSADENRGTVTGSGIFYEGETATLTATANDGYVFGSWTDGNTDNPRTVTVTENATYTATFKAWRTITVISANETQGTVSGSGTYLEDAEIEISAIPAEHHHFTQWNDGNTDNPRTITVSVNATYTASFAIDQHTVTVVSADTEMGTVSEGGTYDYGTEIQISATPAEGYGFATWNDGNTDNPRTVTVTEDITYTATFGAWRTITVLSADETMGTVSGGGVYVEGAQVEISAEAVEHYHFAQWNDGNTDNPRTITVTGDATYTASFAIDRFTITVESANEAMGTVSESNSYDYGTEIQISATASNGYHFAQWSDGNTDNPRTITVTGDATYIATFAPNNYTIVVRSLNEDWGTVSEGGTFPYGTEIQISATPRENYAFVAWTDGNTDNPRTITVVADAEYAAAFTWSVGIDESAVSEIALFPNPATDILNITSSETISEIEIVNVMGQVVRRIEVNSDNAVCDVEGLKSGVYVVKVSTLSLSKGATVSQRKFIKE